MLLLLLLSGSDKVEAVGEGQPCDQQEVIDFLQITRRNYWKLDHQGQDGFMSVLYQM